jgi:hypothetical protein
LIFPIIIIVFVAACVIFPEVARLPQRGKVGWTSFQCSSGKRSVVL